MSVEAIPPSDTPPGFRGFLKQLARPVLWAWDKLDHLYSKITALVFVIGVLGATGLFTWADVASWLRGGWWFAVVAAGVNLVVIAWFGKAAHSLEAARISLAAIEATPPEPARGGEPTALSVEAEWGGVGWKRDSHGAPQPFCVKDKTPLMVAHEEVPELGPYAADSRGGESMSNEKGGYLMCPRCGATYERPGNRGLESARVQAGAVLIGELRTQRDRYRPSV
jgi:hypothetical protein